MQTRRTKIVATLGPASREPEQITALLVAGVDVFRINCSHASADGIRELVARIRRAAPSVTASVRLTPWSRSSLIDDTTMTPASTVCPSSAMPPTIAETETFTPAAMSVSAAPGRHIGTAASTTSALRTRWKTPYSSRQISSSTTGRMSARRRIARCWLSNSPPQVVV